MPGSCSSELSSGGGLFGSTSADPLLLAELPQPATNSATAATASARTAYFRTA